MFVCEKCGEQSKPGEASYKVVVERRVKTYPPRPRKEDPGGQGFETVRELTCCEGCYLCSPYWLEEIE